jgi:hypothetical protein
MAWRMLMTPTLLDADEPAAAGVCAQTTPVLNTHAAARAAVRVNTFRDRKTVNIFRDREAVNNLEFTFFSLLWSATERPGRTRAKWAWLKSDSAPSGFYECIANFKV